MVESMRMDEGKDWRHKKEGEGERGRGRGRGREREGGRGCNTLPLLSDSYCALAKQ